MDGFDAPVSFRTNEQGEAVLTTEGMSYQRSLVAGDTLTFSVQGKGADFDAGRASFSFTDTDVVPDPPGCAGPAHPGGHE